MSAQCYITYVTVTLNVATFTRNLCILHLETLWIQRNVWIALLGSCYGPPYCWLLSKTTDVYRFVWFVLGRTYGVNKTSRKLVIQWEHEPARTTTPYFYQELPGVRRGQVTKSSMAGVSSLQQYEVKVIWSHELWLSFAYHVIRNSCRLIRSVSALIKD